MRKFCRLLVVPLAGLLLAAPVGAAHAAKAKVNPWSAYYPAKGVTCTSAITRADGTTKSQRTTVLAKSAKKIVTRTSGEGRTTSLLLSGGRLKDTVTAVEHESGMKIRVSAAATFVAPSEIIRHLSGSTSASLTVTLTVPRWMAKLALRRGRTVTMLGRYRIAGLGEESITLADPAATVVTALGTRTTMRSLTVTNAKPGFARELRKEMRPVSASADDTEWVARHRGLVKSEGIDEDGTPMTQTQVSCS